MASGRGAHSHPAWRVAHCSQGRRQRARGPADRSRSWLQEAEWQQKAPRGTPQAPVAGSQTLYLPPDLKYWLWQAEGSSCMPGHGRRPVCR